MCRELGVDAFAVGGDLAQLEACYGICEAIKERWTSLDVLVNNASMYTPAAFETLDDATWEQMQSVNLRAPFVLSRELLPLLKVPVSGGLVVHMCDIGAERPFKGYTHYSVSKAALVMLVRSMAVELAPAVRAVGISPGHVAWPEGWDEDVKGRMLDRIPMGRVGTPEDVARLVRFLLLEGTYINGEVIAVDGGLSCRY